MSDNVLMMMMVIVKVAAKEKAELFHNIPCMGLAACYCWRNNGESSRERDSRKEEYSMEGNRK